MAELNEKQVAKIEKYLRDESALNRAVASTLTKKRKSYLARRFAMGDNETIRQALLNRIRSLGIGQQVKDAICTGYDWCNKRSKRDYNVITALVRILLPLFNPMAGAIANIIFIVKHGLFDNLCDCPSPAKIL